MIPVERLVEAAKEAAQQTERRLVEEKAVSTRRWEEKRKTEKARQRVFEKQKGRLQEEAQRTHEARFEPLQRILDHFTETLEGIRDKYFPNSIIFMVDHYKDSYDEEHQVDNVYYRAAMLVHNRDTSPGDQAVLGVYVIAREPHGKKFIKFGPQKDTKFSVAVENTYIYKHELRNFLELAQGASQDFQRITPQEDLFNIAGPETIFYVSHHATAPLLSEVKPYKIPFKDDEATFTQVAGRFQNILELVELSRLRSNIPT